MERCMIRDSVLCGGVLPEYMLVLLTIAPLLYPAAAVMGGGDKRKGGRKGRGGEGRGGVM